MGYEVIDERGTVTGGDRGPASARAPEPYDLGELEPVAPRRAGDPDLPDGSPGASRRLRRAELERLLRLPAVLTSSGLVAGALLGGYVVHQHAAGEQQAHARSTVNAVAVAENQLATGINGVRMAALTVRLTNFGAMPIEPVLSPDGHRPSKRQPLIEASTPHPRAAPDGGSTLVTITVPLPCDTRLGKLRLPVRSADRSKHEVEVTSVASEILEQDRTMCFDGYREQTLVEASLSGTVDDPYVLIRNKADQARRIWPAQHMDSLPGAPGVAIRLVPALPQDVDGNSTLRIRLVVTADRCVRDVAKLEEANMWMALRDSDIGRATPPTDDYRGVLGFESARL